MKAVITTHLVLIVVLAAVGCKTVETGGKVVDSSRGEVIISSNGDQRSALPEGSKDDSLSKAREKLEAQVAKNPKDLPSLLSLAQLQMAQDRFQDADETCRRALRLDIKSVEAHKILAQVAIRQGNHEMAMIFLTALGGDQSKDSDVLNMLALVAMAHSDNGAAMRLWKQALVVNPTDISVRMNLGVLYLKYRLLSQASVQFERVLKSAPNHQDAKLHLAIINANRGQNANAIVTYKEILAGDKDNPLALYNLAVAQKELSQLDDAIDTLKHYIQVSPGKSAHTDQAFAMIDDINAQKSAQGQKVSDDDIQSLAQGLETQKPTAKVDQSAKKPRLEANQESVATPAQTRAHPATEAMNNKPAAPAAKPTKTVDYGADDDVDSLETQLKSPAH